MDAAKSDSSNPTSRTLEGGIRAIVRDHKLAKAAEPASEACEEILETGARSIADIEKLVEELQEARDYLQSEGERVRQENTRYIHLAQTASASVKIIAENIGRWRNPDAVGRAAAAGPRIHAPSLSAFHSERRDRPNDR